MTPFGEIERRRRNARSSYTDIKKHYVRINGWLPVFRLYSASRGKDIRYLTLCAKYAIDVRYFRQKGLLAYDAAQKLYPTVTFVEKDTQDYAIIAEGLGTTRLGIRGDLEDILVRPEHNPELARRLGETFPYDIINLDFTGEVVRGDDPPYSQTIRAIEKVMELQSQANCERWHLFLTFRACPETANHEADDELCNIIEDNLRNAGAQEAYGERALPRELEQTDYCEFLRIGIAKFLASSASNRGYACTLDGSYTYPRNPGEGQPEYRIVKLIVGFAAIRRGRNLPNPERARTAYQACVPQIFQSEAVNVFEKLQSRVIRQGILDDIGPVLEELREQNIVG